MPSWGSPEASAAGGFAAMGWGGEAGLEEVGLLIPSAVTPGATLHLLTCSLLLSAFWFLQ